VPLIFFSISQSKLPSYILPAFPALAVIVGFEIERFWRGTRDRLLVAAAWLTALSRHRLCGRIAHLSASRDAAPVQHRCGLLHCAVIWQSPRRCDEQTARAPM